MKRNFLVVVLLTIAAMVSLSVLADGEYYIIGSNPEDATRVPNPRTDAIVKLTSDSPVITMNCGGGERATGKKLKAGEMVVVDKTTHVAKWVARCGNTIVEPNDWVPQGPVIPLDGGQPPQASATPAASQPQQVQVDVRVHQDESERDCRAAYEAETHPDFWDMIAASFAQALAQGLGQGLAYRMVWGSDTGYGYGGFAPVVYYPPPAYYGGGGGGGDVFITKNITKTYYINSFNSSATTITNPGGPRGGGGAIDPPADPGSGGGTGGGGTGGGPTDPGANLRAQRNNAGRGESLGSRKPLTESQVARDFNGQSGNRPQAHGPTVGNDAWTPSVRGGERYQPGNSQRGGRQIMPSQRQPRQMVPRQNSPRYGTQSSRGWSAPRAPQPRQSAPRFSAPSRPFTPAFGGGGYARPSTPAFRGGRK